MRQTDSCCNGSDNDSLSLVILTEKCRKLQMDSRRGKRRVVSGELVFMDVGVNLKVLGLTEKLGGWEHRIVKICAEKGRFCTNFAKTGNAKPPAPTSPFLRVFCAILKVN